jgi:hypothetical protein
MVSGEFGLHDCQTELTGGYWVHSNRNYRDASCILAYCNTI